MEEQLVNASQEGWQTFDLTAALDPTQTSLVGIGFYGNTGSYHNPGNPIYLDDVSITTGGGAVPEPSGWAMMVAGFGTLGFLRRRRAAPAAA